MLSMRGVWWIAMTASLYAATPWDDLRLRNPSGFTFELRIARPHTYRQSELIRIEMDLPTDALEWQFSGVLIDPPSGQCGGVAAKPCFGTVQMVIRNGPMAQGQPDLLLNEFVPVLSPGSYRVAGLMRRRIVTSRPPGHVSYGYADPPQYLVSNTVQIEVKQPEPGWTNDQLAKSVVVLRREANSKEDRGARYAAAQQ